MRFKPRKRKQPYIRAFTIALTWMSSANTSATDSHVYCGKTDSSDWYWLKDSNNNPVTAQGVWRVVRVGETNTYTNAFKISANEYDRLKPLCGVSYVPQPAKHRFSDWSIFAVATGAGDGGYYLTPGYYDHIAIVNGSYSKVSSAFRL